MVVSINESAAFDINSDLEYLFQFKLKSTRNRHEVGQKQLNSRKLCELRSRLARCDVSDNCDSLWVSDSREASRSGMVINIMDCHSSGDIRSPGIAPPSREPFATDLKAGEPEAYRKWSPR